MRVTIIPQDTVVIVDGRAFSGIDMSYIDPSYHAIQWYDTHGDIEIYANGQIVETRAIDSLAPFQPALDAWEIKKEQADQPPPPPTLQEKIQNYNMMTQVRLDLFAQTRGYFGLLYACSYINSTVASYQQEAQYCIDVRDQTWESANQIFNDVQAGLRPLPETFELFAQELPALQWPVT
jgi:hypothetical protein